MRAPQLRDLSRPSVQWALNLLTRKLSDSIAAVTWAAQQELFVGLHGDDANDGTAPERAFRTFTAAIAAANALTPASDNRIAIVCGDAGTYIENLTIPSWVGILAQAARIDGAHNIADNALLESFRLTFDGVGPCVSKTAGAGSSTVVCPRMVLGNGANGVLCTAGSINYVGESLELVNGFGIGSISTSNIDAYVNQIIVTGTGIAVGLASSGEIDFKGNRIEGGVGSTGFFVSSTGKIHAIIGHIECATAYNVAGAAADLDMFVADITGTRTSVGTANISIAGFNKQQISLVAADPSSNAGAFERLGAGIFNADGYHVGATFTLRAACQVDNGQTYEVRVYDVTAGAYLAGTISDTNASLEVKTLPLTLGAGERIYELHARLTTGSGGTDYVRVPSAFIDVVP